LCPVPHAHTSTLCVSVIALLAQSIEDRHTSVLQDALPDEKSVHLEFHDVTHFIQGRCVLNSVSGEALPRRILAIAGASGAGELRADRTGNLSSLSFPFSPSLFSYSSLSLSLF
jgi:hypothetical protein